MTAFGPERAEDVLARCQSTLASIGEAFTAAFGGEFEVRAASATPLQLDDAAPKLVGGGLAFGIAVGDTLLLAALTQADALLPQWCAAPDEDGIAKLDKLSSDLAAGLLPEDCESKPTRAALHPDLAAAVRDAQPTDDCVCLPLEIAKGDDVAQLSLIWPVTGEVAPPNETPHADEKQADELSADTPGETSDGDMVQNPSSASEAASNERGEKTAHGATAAPQASGPAPKAKLPKHRRLIYRNLEDGIRQLPAYAQSLLRVQVPVTVTLAEAKTPVSKILDMGPGTILQFKKACDSNLTLEVGRQTVAEGEAVKVGDKFGLWITSMTMPGERFWSVNTTASVKRVK